MDSKIIQFKTLPESKLKELFERLESIELKLIEISNNKEISISDEDFLTRAQVSQLLQVSRQTLVTWHNKGILRAIRIGTRVRYRKSELIKLQPLV
ncbi:MAG: helix-turn-helix domain-containing protein [Flavobacteriales bacterium]|nr:helix-turn-helix domain-containing protein [Flavobacteriales bacterium]